MVAVVATKLPDEASVVEYSVAGGFYLGHESEPRCARVVQRPRWAPPKPRTNLEGQALLDLSPFRLRFPPVLTTEVLRENYLVRAHI